MSHDDLGALVASLEDDTPRAELEQLRREGRRPDAATMRSLIAEATSPTAGGPPSPGFAELVRSYERGEAPVSLLLSHPRMHAALQRRIERVLRACESEEPAPPAGPSWVPTGDQRRRPRV